MAEETTHKNYRPLTVGRLRQIVNEELKNDDVELAVAGLGVLGDVYQIDHGGRIWFLPADGDVRKREKLPDNL